MFQKFDFFDFARKFCVAGNLPDWRNFSKIKRMPVLEAGFWNPGFSLPQKSCAFFRRITSSQCIMLYSTFLNALLCLLSLDCTRLRIYGFFALSNLGFGKFCLGTLGFPANFVCSFGSKNCNLFCSCFGAFQRILCCACISLQQLWCKVGGNNSHFTLVASIYFTRKVEIASETTGTYPWSTDQSSKPIVSSQKPVQTLGLVSLV